MAAEDAELAKRTAILVSIPGIGGLTATVLLIEMPELGSIDAKQAASLAGLAPMTQSPEPGKAKTTAVVEGLFCATPSLCRCSSPLVSTLISSGFTAVMRKLAVFANALLKKGRRWEEKSA